MQVVSDPNERLFQALGALGTGLGQLGGATYNNYRGNQQSDLLSNILQNTDNETDALQAILKNKIPYEIAEPVLSLIKQNRQQSNQQNALSLASKAAQSSGGINTPEGRAAFVQVYTQNNGDISKLPANLTALPNANRTQTPSEKLAEKKKFDLIASIESKNEKFMPAVRTLDQLDKMVNDLDPTIPKNFIEQHSPLPYGKSAQYNIMASDIMAPVFDMVNPRGTLATKKIEMVSEQYKPKATDTRDVKLAKHQAVRNLTNYARERYNTLMALYESDDNFTYSDLLKALNQIDKEMDKTLDNMIENAESGSFGMIDSQPGEKSNSKQFLRLPPNAPVGDVLIDSETGTKYVKGLKNWRAV